MIIAAAVAGGYLLLKGGYIPANADAPPSAIETWAANTSLDATLAREAPKGPNPIATTDANLIDGIDLYAQHCAICHGTAKGTASMSPVAKGLYPRPPQLATDGVENDPEGVSFWKIEHGILLDRHAVLEGHSHRSADLDARPVLEAHGQASAGCTRRLGESQELEIKCLNLALNVGSWRCRIPSGVTEFSCITLIFGKAACPRTSRTGPPVLFDDAMHWNVGIL